MALEADAAQHDHLIVAFGLLEGRRENLLGILVVATEIFLERLRDALGRVAQAIAVRIVSGPTQDRMHGRLDFLAAGAVRFFHGLFFVLFLQGRLFWVGGS